jgi:hypothetical protein
LNQMAIRAAPCRMRQETSVLIDKFAILNQARMVGG